jgi:hypothetical protein
MHVMVRWIKLFQLYVSPIDDREVKSTGKGEQQQAKVEPNLYLAANIIKAASTHFLSSRVMWFMAAR